MRAHCQKRAPGSRSAAIGSLRRFQTALLLLVVNTLFVSPQGALAQFESFRQSWRWVEFTTESGLPSNHIAALAETPNGSMWAGTQAGLAWYDGYQWTPITPSKGLPSKPPSSIATYSSDKLLVVIDRRLYLGDQHGFAQVFLSLGRDTVNVQSAVPFEGTDILMAAKKLYVYRKGKTELANLPADVRGDGYPNLWRTRSGGIWVNTVDGLFKWEKRKWKRMIPSENSELGVKSVVEDSLGNGIAAVVRQQNSEGLWEWRRGGTPRRSRTEHSPFIQTMDIAPGGNALAVYEPGDTRFRHRGTWHSLDPVPPELANTIILKFRPNGELWVGTERGLYLHRSSSQRWTYWRHPFPDLRNSVHDICRTSDGSVWLATVRGVEIHRPNGTITWIQSINGVPLNIVTGIIEDAEHNVWICSGASFPGAYRWDGKNWKHFGAREGLKAPRVHEIKKDREGRLWFLGLGTTYEDPEQPGAFLYTNGHFEHWGTNEGLINGRVYGFAEGADGSYWFATKGGLTRFRGGTWKQWTRDSGLLGHLDRIFTLAIDSTGTVWFSDQHSGLAYVDTNDDVHYLTTSDGLINDEIWDLRVDQVGTLWISTNGGLCSYRNGVWTRFDMHSGLNTLNLWGVLPLADKVYVGSPGSGVNILNRTELSPPPRVVMGRPSLEGDAALVRWQVYPYLGEMSQEDVEVRSRLDGGPWSTWSTKRELALSNLREGEHTVSLEAKSLFGNINQEQARTVFTIQSPFYYHPVFILPFGLLALTFLFLAAAYIDKKRKYEADLRENQERFQLAARATNDTIYDRDIVTGDQWVNEGVQRIFGYPLGGGSYDIKWWLEHVHPDDRQRVNLSLHEALRSKSSFWQSDYRFRKADNSYAHVYDRAYVIYDERREPIRMIGSAMDITERKRAEEAVRQVSQRILQAQENERRRVSRELHDGVIQILASVKFRMESFEERIPARLKLVRTGVRQTRQLVDRVMLEVRRISRNLRPSELDDLGLLSAVSILVDEFAERTGLRIDLDFPELKGTLRPEVELTLYRIIQEGLTNVERHSKATRVTLRVSEDDSSIIATLHDNGRGFAKQRSGKGRAKNGGMGLVDIKERVSFLNGDLQVSSAPRMGTSVTVRIPLNESNTGQSR
jgi:PAS domain S-box-containing protein